MIKKWLEETIIGLDLCPFAKRPYLEGKILIEEISGETPFEAQDQFLDHLNSFQAQKKFETVLLVYSDWKISFEDFHDFSQDCQGLLADLDLQDEFQIVTFHPEFCFEGEDFSARGNLVNSSPLPLIHILKIHDIAILNLRPEDAEMMSFGNSKKLELMSPEDLKIHFPWRC